MGHRVMTIAPRYDQYKDAWDTSVLVEVYVFVVLLCSLHLTWSCLMIFIFYKKLKYVSLPQVNIGDTVETVRFFHCHKRGVDRVFVDHPMFLEKVCWIYWSIVCLIAYWITWAQVVTFQCCIWIIYSRYGARLEQSCMVLLLEVTIEITSWGSAFCAL